MPGGAFENRVGQFNGFLDGVDGSSRKPQFNFMHLELPHAPWQYLPSGQSYSVKGPEIPGLKDNAWGHDPWLAMQGYQRYLLQLGFVDRLLGRVVRRLRDEGLYDRALFILTADHGISFHPGASMRGVSRSTPAPSVADQGSVPLFVKAPHQRAGRVDDGSAQTIDILPTIADTLDARLRGRVDGRPLGHDAVPDAVLRVGSCCASDARFRFSEFVRLRDAEVRRRISLFGADDGFMGVFGGANRDLMGKTLTHLRSRSAPGARAEMDTQRVKLETDAEGPAFVTGKLTANRFAGAVVAVAANGRVVAVTRSYRDGDDFRFGAVVVPVQL